MNDLATGVGSESAFPPHEMVKHSNAAIDAKSDIALLIENLFFANVNAYGGSCEIPSATYLVLKETVIWLFDVLWQVSIEDKCRYLGVWNLRAIFNLDIFPFC